MSIFENPTKKAIDKHDMNQFVEVAFDKSGLLDRHKLPNNFVEYDYMSTVNVRRNGKNNRD